MREHVAAVAARARRHRRRRRRDLRRARRGARPRTWNPRLGILGGLSILGTTGVVVPYSCSAWIDSIRRGIDVARAAGHQHVAGCTGSTSASGWSPSCYGLPEDALLDMGDFAGAVLKYLRRHPVPRLTIAGGIGKLAKLADGHLDLHSGRSQVRPGRRWPRWSREAGGAGRAGRRGRGRQHRARRARSSARRPACRSATWSRPARARPRSACSRGAPVEVDVVVIGRTVVGRADPARPRSRPAGLAASRRRVQVAVGELRRGRAPGRRSTTAVRLHPGRLRPAPAMSASVPRRISSSSRLARATTATGQSAP